MTKPKKILIVDDEPDIRKAIEETLDSQCVFIGAGRGDEALELFLKFEPHAVILDVQLDGILQGTHLLPFIKRGFPETVVVMVSARSELKEELLKAGADCFFDKPFDASELRSFFAEKGLL